MFCLSPAKQYRVLKYSLYLILPIQKLLYIYNQYSCYTYTIDMLPVHCLYDIPLIYSYILTVYYVSLLHPHHTLRPLVKRNVITPPPHPLPPPTGHQRKGGKVKLPEPYLDRGECLGKAENISCVYLYIDI